MSSPLSLFPVKEPDKKDESEILKGAPRWVLATLVLALFMAVTYLSGKLDLSTTREQERLAAAVADAPSKYQARLSERVAVVESDTRQLRASMVELTSQIKEQNKSMQDLTVQMKLLTTELKFKR